MGTTRFIEEYLEGNEVRKAISRWCYHGMKNEGKFRETNESWEKDVPANIGVTLSDKSYKTIMKKRMEIKKEQEDSK